MARMGKAGKARRRPDRQGPAGTETPPQDQTGNGAFEVSIVQIDSGAHVTVCNDSRGLTQFAYTRSGSGWYMAGLSAELCEQLASALTGEASRQRREAGEDGRMADFYAAMRADEQVPA